MVSVILCAPINLLSLAACTADSMAYTLASCRGELLNVTGVITLSGLPTSLAQELTDGEGSEASYVLYSKPFYKFSLMSYCMHAQAEQGGASLVSPGVFGGGNNG